MAVEKKLKNKIKKTELLRDKVNALQKKREELEEAIKTIEKLESEFKETIEIIKGREIDILIAHHGTSTFAAFGGIVTSAKLDPEDKFVPQIGEAIATQRLINKILEANYGAKF